VIESQIILCMRVTVGNPTIDGGSAEQLCERLTEQHCRYPGTTQQLTYPGKRMHNYRMTSCQKV